MVVLLSALLLMAVFRSVFIPIKAALMNLLSIGAALGFVTLVFQDGFLADALSVGTGPVESFVPVMLFAIVFGLSMDYEMFLVSRIHEEWLRTGDASRAVRNGVATTGRVITAAASIMIVVFLVFGLLGGERVIKEFGLGLAMAVLLDALIIRCLLVPAIMQIVGRRAWAFPRWLDRRIPRVAIEPE
jgi:putative drug exporter of the RND superfamily